MKNGKITLALVDDHQIVIDGLTSLLKGNEKFKFAFATTNSAEVVEKIATTPIDVLLTDVMMPQLSGNHLAKRGEALAIRVAPATEVKFGLVADSDEKLTGRRIGRAAGHRHRAVPVP